MTQLSPSEFSLEKYGFQPCLILNITPDSFSDGGKISSPQDFIAKVKTLQESGVTLFDIGAESTAPFNDPIDQDTEWSRWQEFLNQQQVKDLLSQPELILSVDTYKPFIIKKVLDCFPQKNIIWNDVSGCLDQEVLDLLKKYPNLKYVFCHNLAPSRELTSSHMDYLDDSIDEHEFLNNILSFFNEAFEQCASLGLEKQLIFDPCFGFSKTLDQNHTLIRELDFIVNKFPQNLPWLLGISRKSFLKALCLDNDPEFFGRELAQQQIILYWLEKLRSREVIIRLHDLRIFNTLGKCQKMLKMTYRAH